MGRKIDAYEILDNLDKRTTWGSGLGTPERAREVQQLLRKHGLECYRIAQHIWGPAEQAERAFAIQAATGDFSARAALARCRRLRREQ